MVANKSQLDIIISAQNKASGELNKVQSDLSALSGVAKVGAKVLGSLGLAMGVQQIGEAVWSLGELGAQASRTKAAFADMTSLVGENSTQMLDSLRAVSRGTISDMDLIQAANRAMALGVAQDGETLAKLMEVATARARVMGLSVSDAFSDLVTGLGRMSPMILDNLGIVTGGEVVFENYARSIGKSAEALTDVEKKAALTNKVISETQSLMDQPVTSADRAAESFERMDAALQNAKVALGELFGPAVAAIAEQIARAATGAAALLNPSTAASGSTLYSSMAGEVSELAAELDRLRTAQEGVAYAGPAWIALQKEINATQASISTLYQHVQIAEATFGGLGSATEMLSFETIKAAAAALDLSNATETESASLHNVKAAIEAVLGPLRQLQAIETEMAGALKSGALGRVTAELGADKALRLYQSQKTVMEDNLALWKSQNIEGDELEFKAAELESRLLGVQNALVSSATATERVSTGVQKVNQEFEKLHGTVTSILDKALDPGVGVDPEKFLPRQDAINEDARRLADIAVRGFESPWLDYFQNKFPALWQSALDSSGGDVQQAAARILRDFQDGLTPQLIDKEGAKERIRRILLGEASMKELADEITGELAKELNLSGGQVATATARVLGVTDTEGASSSGEALGRGFVEGVEAYGPGKRSAEAIKHELEQDAVRAILSTSGGAAGGVWGVGFLARVKENVPARLIEILADLVAPIVEARQTANATAEGAI